MRSNARWLVHGGLLFGASGAIVLLLFLFEDEQPRIGDGVSRAVVVAVESESAREPIFSHPPAGIETPWTSASEQAHPVGAGEQLTKAVGHMASNRRVENDMTSRRMPKLAGDEVLARVRELPAERERARALYLKGVDLGGVELEGADLRFVDFEGSDLDDADLAHANLQQTSFVDANLSGATLVGADIRATNMAFADLRGADLRDVNGALLKMDEGLHAVTSLLGADLRGADLRGADLRGADLLGADLRDADLRGANLRSAIYDQETRFAPGFDSRLRGMVLWVSPDRR